MDAYEVLGLPPTASLDEAERAYRRLARCHHPDLHHAEGPDAVAAAEARTRLLNAAIGDLRRAVEGRVDLCDRPPGHAGSTTGPGSSAEAGTPFGASLFADEVSVTCPRCGQWFTDAPAYVTHLSTHDAHHRRRFHRRRFLRPRPPVWPLWWVVPFNVLAAVAVTLTADVTWGSWTVAGWAGALSLAPSAIRLLGRGDAPRP
jgi:hypothetical protein